MTDLERTDKIDMINYLANPICEYCGKTEGFTYDEFAKVQRCRYCGGIHHDKLKEYYQKVSEQIKTEQGKLDRNNKIASAILVFIPVMISFCYVYISFHFL